MKSTVLSTFRHMEHRIQIILLLFTVYILIKNLITMDIHANFELFFGILVGIAVGYVIQYIVGFTNRRKI